MSDSHWQALRQVLDGALELPPEERLEFVAQACGENSALRREVESILFADQRDGERLEQPILRLGRGYRGPTPAADSGEHEPLTHAGPYRLSELLGAGGMGRVYLGRRDDQAYQKQVAVKVLRPGVVGDELRARFRSERQILAGLEHPYIAKLLDGGTTEDGRPYLVMEFVVGRSIVDYCRQQQLSVAERLALMIKVCEAIQFAHTNLVVHRDLKPGNILVTEEGTPKLLDFGIAKILRPEDFPQTVMPTRTGMLPMTPEYASPEQVRGEAITTATDVYALGLLLFELLSEERPFTMTTGSLESVVDMICRQPAPKPSSLVRASEAKGTRSAEAARRLGRRLSGDLDAIVLRALRKEPAARYSSAAQLGEELQRHLQGHPVAARRGTITYAAGKFIRRHRVAVASVTGVFVLLVDLVVTLLLQRDQILDQRDRVLLERNRAEEVSGWWLNLFELPAPSRARGEQVTARELLEKGARSIDELEDVDLKADLFATIGHTFVQLGLLREGGEYLTRSIELTRLPEAKFSGALGRRLEWLCEALTLRGEWTRAEQVGQELLAWHQEHSGQGAATALALARLGHLQDLQGRHPAAEEMFRQALDLARVDGDRLALAKVLEYFADQQLNHGQLDRAAAMYRESLGLLRAAHGELHPDVALMQSNLARTLSGEPAEQLFEAAIAGQRRLFDQAHPVLATALSNLGLLLYQGQRFGEAKEKLEEALALQRRLEGEQHAKYAVMLGNLANVELALGITPRAEELTRQAIAVFEDSIGTEHADYALSLNNMAELQIQKGNLAGAAELAAKAHDITAAAVGDRHPRMATVLNTLGQIELRKSRPEEAQRLLQRAVDVAEATLGDRHPTLPSVLTNLSVAQTRLEQPEAAVDAMSRVLSIIEPAGTRTPRRLQCLALLAGAESELGRFEAAALHAREAFDGWAEIAGETHGWTLSSQYFLGFALTRLGELDEARNLLRDLVQKLEAASSTRPDRLERARRALAEANREV